MKMWMALVATVGLGIVIYSITDTDGTPGAPHAADRRAAAAPRSEVGAHRAVQPRAVAPLSIPVEVLRPERTDDATVGGNAKPAPSSEQVRDRFETFFSTEAVDPAWNREAADTLAKGVHAVLPAGSSLRRIECRGTLCRVETSHVDVAGFRAFAQHAFLDRETRVGSSGFFASLLGEPAPDGAVTAVAYLAREGKELPGPESLFASP